MDRPFIPADNPNCICWIEVTEDGKVVDRLMEETGVSSGLVASGFAEDPIVKPAVPDYVIEVKS